jgi:TolA-binding protein
MRTSVLLPLALVAALGACSGDSAPTAFSNPEAAMDAADSAKAAKDYVAAKASYQYALENGSESLQADAMFGLLDVNIADLDEPGAIANFARLSSDFTASLTQGELSRCIDVAVMAKMVDLSDKILDYAISTYPEMKDALGKASLDLELIKTERPGAANMAEVGYAGD